MTEPKRQRRTLGVVDSPAPSDAAWTLIVNGYCHLCDDMRAALQPYLQQHRLPLRELDIDQHPELEERWGEWVPVLLFQGEEVCHYHLDVARLEALLGQAPG